ncbi:MAG: hypothetical protein LHW63_03540, partial [Candidatus Cloacimonetes bacterium]|nr:hypothetical protein [Candidatus Cloacimonadota bacterium]
WGSTTTDNDNGEFKISFTSVDSDTLVAVLGLGKEDNGTTKPAIMTTITLPEGKIVGTPKDVDNGKTISTLAVGDF